MSTMGSLFDVQKFAVHDGPGIRTTVFFKGCNNHCMWCHNPESLIVKPQIEFYPTRCIGCGKCFTVCPNKVHTVKNGEHVLEREKCSGCGLCCDTCYSTALTKKGYTASVDAVMEQIRADKPYYESSGGGITLSGGEPLLQPAFAKEILMCCKQEGIHTAIQTAGNVPYENLAVLLPYLDLIMYDIKGFSQDVYTWHIRGDRKRILDNLACLCKDFAGQIAVRTPVVGGVNDTLTEIVSIAEMLKGLENVNYYQLMPYHALGKAKYDALGETYDVDYYTPTTQAMTALEDAAAQHIRVLNYTRGYIDCKLAGGIK